MNTDDVTLIRNEIQKLKDSITQYVESLGAVEQKLEKLTKVLEPTTFDFEDGSGPVPSHQHKNGGGWVAETATVEKSAFVGPDAWVFGHAWVSGEAQVFGNARVSGDARVFGNARVSGHAWVSGDAWVSGGSYISGAHEFAKLS